MSGPPTIHIQRELVSLRASSINIDYTAATAAVNFLSLSSSLSVML